MARVKMRLYGELAHQALRHMLGNVALADQSVGLVLVVEDDRHIAALVKTYLEQEGFAVAVAHDGAEGLDVARSGSLRIRSRCRSGAGGPGPGHAPSSAAESCGHPRFARRAAHVLPVPPVAGQRVLASARTGGDCVSCAASPNRPTARAHHDRFMVGVNLK